MLALAGCNNAASGPPPVKMLTYDELFNFETKCELATQQQAMLKTILERKNFDPDPDMLSEPSRKYNSMLKAKIWWYAVRCAKS